MIAGRFARAALLTLGTSVLNLLIGVGVSIILARALGPEGNGIYALALLLPSFIITFGNLGIGSATVYYVARGEFRRQEIVGSNVLLSIGISILGVFVGLVVVLFFRKVFFAGIATGHLLLGLALIPVEVLFANVGCVLLGAQHIKEFNYIRVIQHSLLLGFTTVALLGLKAGVTGALLAALSSWLAVDVLALWLTSIVTGGIDFKPNAVYMKRATAYGIQAHLANILGFLNYRVDMVMVNGFLGPAAVGLYAVGVGLVERLWIISQAASTILFPRVAAETEEERRKAFTPLVARTVLWTTAMSALMLALLSRWIVLLLYSEAFLPAVNALQALLVGIVALSAGRVLANDIAGRGFPKLNIYTGLIAVVTNITLNLLWIPRYGIAGAGWASTASYTVSFLGILFFYCRLSGNRWIVTILPQRGDWAIYWNIGKVLFQWAWGKVWAGKV